MITFLLSQKFLETFIFGLEFLPSGLALAFLLFSPGLGINPSLSPGGVLFSFSVEEDVFALVG